jgi:hypothetical protein
MQKVCKTPISIKSSVVVYACHPSYGGKYKIGGQKSRPAQAKSEMLCSKYQSKSDGGITQVVEYLPSKYEALV